MDTRRRGALDFGYKVAPVLGIAPNGRHVGAVRDHAEEKRTPERCRVYYRILAKKGIHAVINA